jgi:hypothetical protein
MIADCLSPSHGDMRHLRHVPRCSWPGQGFTDVCVSTVKYAVLYWAPLIIESVLGARAARLEAGGTVGGACQGSLRDDFFYCDDHWAAPGLESSSLKPIGYCVPDWQPSIGSFQQWFAMAMRMSCCRKEPCCVEAAARPLSLRKSKKVAGVRLGGGARHV